MRSFGPKKGRTTVRETFEFWVLRDDEPEMHTFQARAALNVAALLTAISTVDKHPERSVAGMQRLIVNMLDNKDGTPANWEPTPLPLPERPARLDGWPDEPDETPVVKFRGPDGNLYPLEEAARFTAREAGSSRRRWQALMDDSDGVVIEAKDLMATMEYLVSLAAGRPTGPSSS